MTANYNFGDKLRKTSKRTSLLVAALAIVSILSIDAIISGEDSFVALADADTWTRSGTVVSTAADTDVVVTGSTTFTDGVYWNHLPRADGKSFITGEEVTIGATTSITMGTDTNVAGDMHFTKPTGSKITSAGDICIGSGCP